MVDASVPKTLRSREGEHTGWDGKSDNGATLVKLALRFLPMGASRVGDESEGLVLD